MLEATGFLTIISGYLLGSIPFAYLAARLIKGVDIRQVGTGNVGAMNTVREIGTVAGLCVLLLDIGKGSLAVAIARWLEVPPAFTFVSGFTVVAGHNWPVFLRFRGGKGAATTLGVLFPLAPLEFAISFALMAVIIIPTRNTGLGIGLGLALLLLLLWWFGKENSLILYSLALTMFLVLRNLPALKRDLANASSLKAFILGRQSSKQPGNK